MARGLWMLCTETVGGNLVLRVPCEAGLRLGLVGGWRSILQDAAPRGCANEAGVIAHPWDIGHVGVLEFCGGWLGLGTACGGLACLVLRGGRWARVAERLTMMEC
eukprot:11778246-Alexandrium_andersonii.AAC.1